MQDRDRWRAVVSRYEPPCSQKMQEILWVDKLLAFKEGLISTVWVNIVPMKVISVSSRMFQ
jgi:hypothetical protein